MKGKMVTIMLDGKMSCEELKRPDSDKFHAAVGGWLELVPYFDTFLWDGELRKCAVFCDEEGKQKGKEPNIMATILWQMAQDRRRVTVEDHLVGNICVVFGDHEFMEIM
jgi:hypothetical protein